MNVNKRHTERETGKKFLVYNASAGSGKTYTLVKEYLRLALTNDNPWYFKRILAITFTKKAAAEMKERVLHHLQQLGQDRESPLFNLALCEDYSAVTGLDFATLKHRAQKVHRAVLHNYSDLSISTIDSFVHLIIRNFSRDLRLPMDFDVVMEKETLVDEAVDRLVDEAGRNKVITEMLTEYLRFNTDEGDKWQLGVLLKKFANEILFREDSLPHLEELRQLEEGQLSELRKQILARLDVKRKKLVEPVLKAIQAIEQAGIAPEDFYYGSGNSAFKQFSSIVEENGRIENVKLNSYLLQAVEKYAWFSKANLKKLGDKPAMVEAELNAALEAVLHSVNDKSYFTDALVLKQLFQLDLIRFITLHIESIKEEKDVLFIDDFTRMISDLVAKDPAPFIYERIGEYFNHIMIDEFQDTSVLQWHNFIPLIENSLSRGLTCLLVGDGKQSIYRFRNGEVEQFAVLPKLFGSEHNELLRQRELLFQTNYNHKNLDYNYRSGKEIVEFNNRFFSHFRDSFQHPLQKVYLENEQLVPEGKEFGYVEIQFSDPEAKAQETKQDHVKRTIAIINDCMAHGFHFSDIAVLVRSNRDGDIIASELSKNNWPVISPDSLLLKSSSQVQLLASLMQWLFDPSNEEIKTRIIELYLSLRDPLADIITELNRCSSNHPLQRKKIIQLEKFLSAKAIQLDRNRLLQFSLYQLAENLIYLLQIERNDAFVNAFLDVVFRFAQRDNDLGAFSEWWIEAGEKQSVQMPETADAIKVMTIHKSKGLQFPIVIMPFLNWTSSKNGKDKLWIDLDDRFEPLKSALISGGEEVFKNIGQAAVLAEEKNRTLLDTMNLLYVGFTRPEERLYLLTATTRNSFIGKLISDYMQLEISGSGNVSYGTKTSPVRKSKKHGEEWPLQSKPWQRWQDKLRISYESQKQWGESEGLISARFGNLVHEVLSQLTSVRELEQVLQKVSIDFQCNPETALRLKQEVERVLSHEFMQRMFDEQVQSKTEAEIVDASGISHRPDRLVFFPDETIVIDFKTGTERDSHQHQIRLYGELLTQMNCPSVKKYLFYTKDSKLQEVH